MSDEEQRLARVEAKVDSIQREVTEMKQLFHKDFGNHMEDDKKNFSKLESNIHRNDVNLTKIQTRLNIWGAVIVVSIPIISIVLKKVLL